MDGEVADEDVELAVVDEKEVDDSVVVEEDDWNEVENVRNDVDDLVNVLVDGDVSGVTGLVIFVNVDDVNVDEIVEDSFGKGEDGGVNGASDVDGLSVEPTDEVVAGDEEVNADGDAVKFGVAEVIADDSAVEEEDRVDEVWKDVVLLFVVKASVVIVVLLSGVSEKSITK